MANEMFTTRSGRQIPVPELKVLSYIVTELMALREEYEQRGQYLSLMGVLLDVIDKGKRTVRYHFKYSDAQKGNRDFTKAITPLMADPIGNAEEIRKIALKYGKIKGTQVDLSTPEVPPEPELTEEQLEAATAPNADVA